MRQLRILLSLFFGMGFYICAFAQGPISVQEINGLISRGNHAYDLSQRTRIRECADSAFAILRKGGFLENDSIDLLASIYKLYGNYHYVSAANDSAEIYYNRAQRVIDSHPNVSFESLTKLLLLRDKAQLYYLQKNYPLAAELMAKADDEIEYQSPYQLGDDNWLITKLTYAMCLARIGDFDRAIQIAQTELSNAIDPTSLSYAKAQRMYAKILMLAKADSVGALKAYKEYFEKQKQDAMEHFGAMDSRERFEYWQTLRPFITDCYLLEDEDAAFLYDVTLFSKGLLLQLNRLSGENVATENAIKSLDYTWRDIQKRLKPKQTAIEFIEYEKDGRTLMAALVLKKTGKPTFVRLTPPEDVLALTGNAIQSTDRNNKDKLYQDTDLHNLVWTKDLLESIAGSERIYFAPDGYLHRLAIEYLPPVKDYELYRLTSTRTLMEKPADLSYSTPTLFIGGINYDLDKSPGDLADNDKSAYTNYLGKSFPRLSESSNEAQTIYSSRHIDSDSLIEASKASEYEFMRLAPNFGSILVSTHGDFCFSTPKPTDIKISQEDEAMSQSVIAFSGVNTYLSERNFNPSTHYDGLVSAKELSHLDLSHCGLFIVSACQSALGRISTDGVYGIQRGLKNAGAQTMLLSLWNVNSDATSKIMEHLYNHLNEGLPLGRAFALARMDLINKVDESKEGDENEKVEKDAPSTEITYVFDPSTMAYKAVSAPNQQQSFDSPQYVNAFIMIDALD